ncbi:YqhG family protein [Cohnella massiliensis]|uniref:YqhG family protein n=1 Tax=Cohnella massiliensis TaxID=1816691 RepID=UPI0009BC0DF1|nr:YqhG family protein [Cohnella massiliensis]
MNAKQVQRFVMSYLEATGSDILEKSPAHVVVRLSPEADRALTNRPYYWSFVDRTGAAPETMTYRWSFGHPAEKEAGSSPADPPGSQPPAGAAMPAMPASGPRAIPEDVYFGSRRLDQFFESVQKAGRCVTMFEEPSKRAAVGPLGSVPYTAWLGANFKVGFECDMKREELFGWGISLATGVIDETFLDRLSEKRMTPRLPANVHLLPNGLSLRKAMSQLEHALERKLKTYDFAWAVEAEERRVDELDRLESYYRPMIERAEGEQKEALQARLKQRAEEIDWQYRPRVSMSVINCGIFHLPGIG